MSEQYRNGGASAVAIRDGLDALGYVVSRMPATFAAARNVFGRLIERCPSFAPRSVLDLGAGPGTASWAAVSAWPAIESITQADANGRLMSLGAHLAESANSAALRGAIRVPGDLAENPSKGSTFDLAILSYTLAELSAAQSMHVLTSAWQACCGALAVVEPGTPRGYERILRARDLLLAEGARIAAPCPHESKCPLAEPDWCHFSQRVARSRDHMHLKSAEVPFEDERFSYVVAVRDSIFQPAKEGRILAAPEIGKASAAAKVCTSDGRLDLVSVNRRNKADYLRIKRRTWGDEL